MPVSPFQNKMEVVFVFANQNLRQRNHLQILSESEVSAYLLSLPSIQFSLAPLSLVYHGSKFNLLKTISKFILLKTISMHVSHFSSRGKMMYIYKNSIRGVQYNRILPPPPLKKSKSATVSRGEANILKEQKKK